MAWTTWFLPLVLFLFVVFLITVIQLEREQQRLMQSAAQLSPDSHPSVSASEPNQSGHSSQPAIAQRPEKSGNQTIQGQHETSM